MKNRSVLVLILVILSIVFIGLSNEISQIWTNYSSQDYSDTPGQARTGWKVKTIQAESIAPHELDFIDEDLGYGYSNTGALSIVYKTSNSGRSWEEIFSSKDLLIHDVFFASGSEGFLLAAKVSRSSSLMVDKGSVIIKTQDGGRTWRTVFDSNSFILREIGFTKEGVGVVVGARPTNRYFSVNLVLFTRDKGETWEDSSESLNQKALNSVGRIDDGLMKVLIKDSDIYTLSESRRIYKSSDEGKSWNLFSQLKDDPGQTAINNFGMLENGSFWLSGGANSLEGTWGMVSVLNKHLVWKTNRLDGYCFTAVERLSDNEVIACGARIPPFKPKGTPDPNEAVILRSPDNGKNWETLYTGPASSACLSASKLSENLIYISQGNGEGILLQR